MFDKRLMAMCPESKKYIVGNIICQWIELLMNALRNTWGGLDSPYDLFSFLCKNDKAKRYFRR